MDKLLSSETAGKVLTKDSACPSLTFQQRLIGFISCVGLGLLFSGISFTFLLMATTSPRKYAIFLSLGNICCVGATLFFVGPARQLKIMFKSIRFIASFLLILSIIGTIVFSFFYDTKAHFWHKFVMFGLIIAQFCASVWYILSYIPFGRAAMKKICCTICCSDDEDSSSGSSNAPADK